MFENEKEIIEESKRIKEDFEAKAETPEDISREKMNFLDKINHLVRLILNDDSVTVYDAFNEENLEAWKKNRSSKWRKFKTFIANNYRKFFYISLLITITGFLVSEALSFYAIDGIISKKTYVKAILTEICFIFLSGYRTESRAGLVWLGFLRTGIFVLMMFVISSQVLLKGTQQIENSNSVSQQIEFIEKQINQKEKDIKYFKEINYPKNATRVTIEKQKLISKLISLKEQQASGSNKEVSDIIKYKMYGKAFFRILLLFISVLITRRLFSF